MIKRLAAALCAAAALAACGGGGGGGSALTPPPADAYVSGSYPPATQYQDRCAVPRFGTNPNTGLPYPDVAGSTLAEQLWLRSWTDELYLWYREVPDINPSGFTVAGYFAALKTSAVTASGRQKDRFHFTVPTSSWETYSQSGVQTGYGAEWAVVSAAPPRTVRVAFVEPGSPAAAANLARGAQVLSVDGVGVATGDADRLNAALFPARSGETHVFGVLDPGAPGPRTVTLVSASVVGNPVPGVATVVANGARVGYLLFNDHVATAEDALITAVSQLRAANVVDLVLDIRYNGGGFIDIASELAYMIAGPARTSGRAFERMQFNDKHPVLNPVTGLAIVPTPFHDRTQGFSVPAGQALPTLDLSTVYVITGPGTCSASETIINGLRGIGVQVVQIGSSTCGKPFGTYPQDNCGTTYFTTQFVGVNDIAFGDYGDGFSPANTAVSPGVLVPGCSVADDFDHALGDPQEGRLAAALAYRTSGSCPLATGLVPAVPSVAATSLASSEAVAPAPAATGAIGKPPLRQTRWYR